MSELFTNNGSTTISGSVGSTDTSLTVAAGTGALFPSPTGSDFFRVVMIKLTTGEWEIAKVTSRATDTFDFDVVGNRGIEGTSALNLNDGDIIEVRPTAAFFSSLLSDVEMQQNAPTYAADTGSANAYVVALSPAWSGSYTAGLQVKFKASNANTGASTLNIDGQGAASIVKDASVALDANDIKANQVVHVVYDGSNFQLIGLSSTSSNFIIDQVSSAPTPGTDQISLYALDVSGKPGFFISPDGGVSHQVPVPYDTILMTEWTSAPAGWEFQSDADDSVLMPTNSIANVGESNVVDTDSYLESNQSATSPLNNAVTAIGQAITGDGNDLTGVQFYLSKTASPTGNAVAKLYAHSGVFGTSSIPTGSELATSGTFDVSTLTTGLQLIRFNFPSGEQYTLANGTNYVIVIEYGSGDITNYVNVGIDNSTPTHGGNLSTFSTPTWTPVAGSDACFRIYTGGSWVITGVTVDGHALTVNEIPSHNHPGYAPQACGTGNAPGANVGTCSGGAKRDNGTYPTGNRGGGASHTHGVTRDGEWRPSYRYVGRFKYVG